MILKFLSLCPKTVEVIIFYSTFAGDNKYSLNFSYELYEKLKNIKFYLKKRDWSHAGKKFKLDF